MRTETTEEGDPLVFRNGTKVANALLNRIETRLGGDGRWSLPVHVTIEPTNRCNGRCAMCLPYRRDGGLPRPAMGFMTWETLESLAPVLRWARRVLLTGNGEPLLHPRYLEMAGWVRERVPYLYLYTNGTLIDGAAAQGLVRAGVDLVSISMGGATDATVEKVRGVQLAAVVAGVERLAMARAEAGGGKPEMEFNVVAMNSVLPELCAIVDIARDHGVARIAMPQLLASSPAMAGESLFGHPEAGAILEGAQEYARSAGIEMKVWDYPPRPATCSLPSSSLFVAYDGDVFPCAAERYVMGNVRREPVVRIWGSSGFRSHRRLLRTSPTQVCPSCPVWSGDPEHYRQAVPHDRRSAGRFDSQGRPHHPREDTAVVGATEDGNDRGCPESGCGRAGSDGVLVGHAKEE